jgi:hypothetical protein
MHNVYVVEMLRYGDRENHSYVIGAYNRRQQAAAIGKAEKQRRDGKYEYVLTLLTLDDPPKNFKL